MSNLEYGVEYLSEGNIEKAEYYLDLAVAEDNQNANVWYNRGKVNRMKGNLIAALNDFHRTVDIDPNHCEAKVSIEMINNIISFRNPDLLNH
jgi:Tfp pilus assembly protein PilF